MDTHEIQTWASGLLDQAYRPPLGPTTRKESIDLILAFFNDIEEMGIDLDDARITLNNEIVDIMPVIEPLRHILRRIRRNLRAGH